MRIVEVINSLSYRGGAQILFVQLCEELAKINDDPVHVIVLYDKVDSSFDYIKTCKNIVFHTIKKRKSFDLKASKTLKQIINSINPDVINYHLPFLTTYYFAFGLKKTRWKLIKTYHSIPNKDTNKVEIFLQKKYVKKGLLNYIGISNTISKMSLELYPSAQVKTIYNGIPANSQYQYNPDAEYDFVIVASFSPVKNHALLFEAFEEYLSYKPDAKLLCVGGGELLGSYIDKTKEKKMENSVTFTNEQANVFEYLVQSKVFVLSSLREGNPISILEALSVGLPVIAPKIGGIPDVIEDGINGVLYECNNKVQLVEAMKKTNDDYFIKNVSSRNLAKSKNYLISNTAVEYFDYFNQLSKQIK